MFAKDYFNDQSDRFITEYYQNHNLTEDSSVLDLIDVAPFDFSSDETQTDETQTDD